MSRTCRVPGCVAETASRFSPYCRNHKARLRRHGAVDQKSVTAADLKPYLARVEARIEKNRENPVWERLEGRWMGVVDHARRILAHFERGGVGRSYERRAAYEVTRLADATKPRDVVVAALAMFVMLELEPRRFRDDQAFRFQLVRRVRAPGDVNAGLSWDH